MVVDLIFTPVRQGGLGFMSATALNQYAYASSINTLLAPGNAQRPVVEIATGVQLERSDVFEFNGACNRVKKAIGPPSPSEHELDVYGSQIDNCQAVLSQRFQNRMAARIDADLARGDPSLWLLAEHKS